MAMPSRVDGNITGDGNTKFELTGEKSLPTPKHGDKKKEEDQIRDTAGSIDQEETNERSSQEKGWQNLLKGFRLSCCF